MTVHLIQNTKQQDQRKQSQNYLFNKHKENFLVQSQKKQPQNTGKAKSTITASDLKQEMRQDGLVVRCREYIKNLA